MKKLFLAITIALMTSQLASAAEFYVSPEGSDNNPGSNDKPFATLARARGAVHNSENGATVWIGGGTYNLNKTLTFTPQDSGKKNAEIIYAAYPGEQVTIKGSSIVTANWKPYKNGIYVCSLKGTDLENINFNQLFCDNKRMVRARYPDWDFSNPLRTGSGYLKCEDGDLTQLTWKQGDFDDVNAKWANPQTGILHAFHRRNWGNMMYKVGDIDWENRQVIFAGHGLQCQRRDGPGQGRGESSPYYIENIFEELTSVHEWFLDIEKNLLYFYPPKGIDINNCLIEAATLKRLIEFKGSPDNPVHHITLKGLHLTQTQSTYMEKYEDLLRGDWSIHHGGAIFLSGAEDCKLQDLWIEQVGGNAIFHSGYNRRIETSSCLIENTGDSAVCYVGDTRAVRHPWTWTIGGREGEEVTDKNPGPKSADYPADCTVKNSIMRDVGVYGKQTSAALVSKSMSITISHCTVYRIPRAGITFNDGAWGGHILEHCDIWDTVMETGEHGPFNSWGRERFWSTLDKDLVLLDALKTTHIRNNRIGNFHPSISAGNWTIDLDDGSSNYHIYNNLSLGSTLKLRDGFYRKVWNNIHVSAVPLGWHCWPPQNEDIFEKNITVVAGAPEGSGLPTQEMIKAAGTISDHPWGARHGQNLWWNVNTNKFAASNKSGRPVNNWREWQELGYGQGSALGDPKFIDPANGDYRVSPDSPALKIGFKNFPMDQFGHQMTRIVPFGEQFEVEKRVTLRPDARGGQVRYTLDGTPPTTDSPLYSRPLKLTETTTIRARTFKNSIPIGFETKTDFEKVDKLWQASWYKCLMAGKWIQPQIELTDQQIEETKAKTYQWRGMKVCNLAEDGDLIDASGGQDYGVYIMDVPKDSPAQKWGFKNADIIIALNGDKTPDLGALKKAERKASSDTLTITITKSYNQRDLIIPAMKQEN